MGLFGRKQKDVGDTVLDLRETPAPQLVWGSPAPCPDCGGRGYLDHIDPFREIMYVHCVACGIRYEIAKADIDAQTVS